MLAASLRRGCWPWKVSVEVACLQGVLPYELPLHSPKRSGQRPQARRMRCWTWCSLEEEAIPPVAGLVDSERRAYA